MVPYTALTTGLQKSGPRKLVFPCGYDGDGMPIGMQFVADHWNENALFTMAEDWEKEFDLRRPEVSA